MGSFPSLAEIDDMLQLLKGNQEALLRLRTAVIRQENALAEQQRLAQSNAMKSNGPDDGQMVVYKDEYKGMGGFAGPDPKKRRGVGAPMFIVVPP